eukprot:CAMPEP_0204371244 /NCGR_PEP_ID=MMETSP0469-20131031/46340_1 /ASSEMBLY_ACC=CAM_ASM_000384 /TAXON_ID=2969 /ORGANISM="Oxyrrhis marina" /LENGTH=297 /DNA_ID=CAMNT_0051361307 /DNA_START=28 /DNA_END=921 /DNA_ORIENTATION=+
MRALAWLSLASAHHQVYPEQHLVVAPPECTPSGEMQYFKFRYAVCPAASTTLDVRCTFDQSDAVHNSQLPPGATHEEFLDLSLWQLERNTTVVCEVISASFDVGPGVLLMVSGSSCPSQDLCAPAPTTISTTIATTTKSSTTTAAIVAAAGGQLVVHQKCDNGVRSSGTYTVQVCPPASQNVTDVTCSAGDSFTIGAGLVVERDGNFVNGSIVMCRTVNSNVEDGTIEWSVTGTCEQGCPAPGAAAVGGDVVDDDEDDGLDIGIIVACGSSALGFIGLVVFGLRRCSYSKSGPTQEG